VTGVREVTELITPGPAEALAGLLDVPVPDPDLPLLWHWVYLLDRPPQAVLGRAWRHGPLQALLMAELARREAALPTRCDYSYRLVAPLFGGQGLIVSASAEDAVKVTVRDGAGRTTAAGVIQPGPPPETRDCVP
jgi:hypothetical protein